MTDSGGHWKTLEEAQKLTQSYKIPGVQEEDIKRNNPVLMVPVAQAAHSGLKIEWLRENTTTEDAVTEVAIGGQLSWSEDIEYEEKETSLKTIYIQRKLAHYNQNIYSTYNNFEARKLIECEKGLLRKIGARFVYGDTTYTNSNMMDGMHALAAEHGSSDNKNIDNGEAGLSLANLRLLLDEMKLGVNYILAPFEIVRHIDAAYQEKGFAGLATATAGNIGFISMGFNEIGKRVLYWDDVPLVRTDYLVGEEANTGTGASSDARALYSSDKQYSVFALRLGDGSLDGTNPGLVFAYGGTEGQGDLYKLVRFQELENWDAGGLRLVSYDAVILPSSHCLGRIFDIEDVAVTV